MIEGVEIGALVTDSIASRESGRYILRALLDVAPQYAPERYNNYEPLKHTFDPGNLEAALDLWDELIWRSKKYKLLGMVGFGVKRVHDSVSFSMSLNAFSLAQTLGFFEVLDSRFDIALGYIHVRVSSDIEDKEHYKRHIMPFQSLTTHDLREGLPGHSWAMWFGEPYRELFGDRLLTVPVFSVRQIGGGVYVQLTESVTDPDKQRDKYLAAQAATQQHLDSDAFRGNLSRKCRVPEFRVPRP